VSLPEARIGMIPAGGASQTLPRIAGTGAALHSILTSERIPASDALARGFVDAVVGRAELRRVTDELADRLAERPTAAVRAAKAAVWAAVDLPLAAGLRRERDLARLVTRAP
jgi:enoyl-CoA hydratase/carnithine racemase